MDRRSWPWKKKSSDKAVTGKTVAVSESRGASMSSDGSQVDQGNSKKINFIQISLESYTHLTELEGQVKMFDDQVKILNEKLSSANSEMTIKDNLVKQHAKVAEEAVSGWEKAEAEALALKHQLESVTLLKLTAEDRASHLDGALKECMRQIRNVKEEHEQKLHEVVLAKTKQWDKIKLELEAKIVGLDQELLRSSAENAALSRSLQQHSNMLMDINKQKSQAEAEIELLKTDIQSCEKEISSLKYEHHIVSKELEIRNEEKNMSIRSAEVASKQHLEGVKKIAKLEAECQRLRGLVRKKLPGPAALAQMKLEVENLGREYGESRIQRSPVKSPSPRLAPLPEFSLDNVQQSHKETEFLTARLLTMEEETKMLKEALAKRNTELQASRNMCAKTTSKLRNLETQMHILNHPRNSLKLNFEIPMEGSLSQNLSNPPSLTSMSEDGVDEEASCAESWATALISELSHFKKDKTTSKTIKAENTNHLELMDDFLEMERLACLSTESNGAISISDSLTDRRTEDVDQIAKGGDLRSEQEPDLYPTANQVSVNEDLPTKKLESDEDQMPLSKLRSRIYMIFESQAEATDTGKILEDIICVLQDMQDFLPQHSVSCIFKKTNSANATCNLEACPKDIGKTAGSSLSSTCDSKPPTDTEVIIDQELATAISQIHDFVVSLGKEAITVHDRSPDGHGLNRKIEEFFASVNKVLCCKMSLVDFVLDLSHVLAKASELSFNVLGYKGVDGETNSSDCIDKVTLLENKVVQDDSLRERFSSGCAHISLSTSDPDVLQEGISNPGFESNVAACKCLSEKLEQLKLEKDSMAMDLARSAEILEHTTFQLQESEQHLAELKSQLASSQKSSSFAETQLKCMTESYTSLETRAEELETEVNQLKAKTETLNDELQEEKRTHQDALAKCKDLQEQIQRYESCSMCSLSSAADVDIKTKQEKEIEATAEKLAECQETIFLLGRQLKALRPTEFTESPYNERHKLGEVLLEDELSPNQQGMHGLQDFHQSEMDNGPTNVRRAGNDSPSDLYDSTLSQSDSEANRLLRSPLSSKRPKHRSTKSTSYALTSEKHSRGLSRFFSSKGKNSH